MKIKVTITGTIDVPDSWADGNCGELRTAEYRYRKAGKAPGRSGCNGDIKEPPASLPGAFSFFRSQTLRF